MLGQPLPTTPVGHVEPFQSTVTSRVFDGAERQGLRVGDRIEHRGHFATVKYIGYMNHDDHDEEDCKGTDNVQWLGLDWDDPNRGKHNGSHKNHHYFVSRTPTSGSFVKLSDLKFMRNSFEQAFLSRYTDLVPESADTPHKISCKIVELVGMEKVALKIGAKPKLVDLSFHFIAFCGKVSEEVKSKLAEVTELVLGHNLLGSWTEIANIVSLFPSLSKLVLTGNRIGVPTDFSLRDVLNFKKVMGTVKTVVLGAAGLTWPWVLCVENQVMPYSLESLELFHNDISDIPKPPPRSAFVSLKHLDLSSNIIAGWSSVCKLGELQQLESLFLNECKIESISFDTDNEKTELFSKLKVLSLKANMIETWKDIAELNKLQALEDLNVKGNPVIHREVDYEVAFNYTLGRVGDLKFLNREVVDTNTGKEAALYYLKRHYEEWLSKKDIAEYAAEHPRFVELLRKYGEIDEDADSSATQNSGESSESSRAKSNKQLVILLKQSDGVELRKKLPSSTTVSNLKTLARRMFSIDPLADVQLVWTTLKQDNFSLTLDEDTKSLHQLSIENDDIILVKDLSK